MDWSTPVDFYCERTDPSFWAEPVNALTNAAFLIAAAAALLAWRRRGGDDTPVLLLILVTACIGVGSFLFHTLATRGAVLLDTIPIAIFVYSYLLLALRRLLHVRLTPAIVILVAFALSGQVLSQLLPAGALNGSIDYLPPLAALVIVGALVRAVPAGRMVLIAAGLFTVSLALRTVDIGVCPMFPLGTHFVWHLLNAVVLYVLLRAALSAHRTTRLSAGSL